MKKFKIARNRLLFLFSPTKILKTFSVCIFCLYKQITIRLYYFNIIQHFYNRFYRIKISRHYIWAQTLCDTRNFALNARRICAIILIFQFGVLRLCFYCNPQVAIFILHNRSFLSYSSKVAFLPTDYLGFSLYKNPRYAQRSARILLTRFCNLL